MAHFNPPQIQDNPSGWGPCAIPDQFKDLPYQPFSKGDRLGKVISYTRMVAGIPVFRKFSENNLQVKDIDELKLFVTLNKS